MRIEERPPVEPLVSVAKSRPGGPPAARWAPLTVCLALAVWAAAGSLLLFPRLTNNNDEAVYLLQADALRHGYLFPPAPENWEAFLPWFGAHDDGRYVLKYTPVHAAIIAAARMVMGTDRAALVAIAFAAAATCYLLACQVLRSRSQAALAAAFFSLSPLVVMQSVTFLSYLSALALLQAFAAALIVGVRRRSPRWLLGAGFLAGLAVFARPYDALLFAAPLGLWAMWVQRHNLRALASAVGWIGLGTVVPVVAMLAFFQAATGSPFDPPFNIDPTDTLGFGPKSMTPGGHVTDYTPELARIGMEGNLRAVIRWSFGGVALVALAIAGLRRLRPREPAPWLALLVLTIPAGYLFFWGSYGTVRWGGPGRLGPHYYLPLLTPLSILGAKGFFALRSRIPRLSIGALLLMAAFSVSTIASAVDANRPYVEGRRKLYEPIEEAHLDNALVFLPAVGSKLVSPYALSRNDAGYDGDVIWAVDRGSESNLDALTEFPERTPYRVVPSHRRKLEVSPTPNFESRLERQRVVRGPELKLELVVANAPRGAPLRLAIVRGTQTESITITPTDRVVRVPVTVGPDRARFDGFPDAQRSFNVKAPRRTEVFAYSPGPDGKQARLASTDIDVVRRGGEAVALVATDPPPATGGLTLFLGQPFR